MRSDNPFEATNETPVDIKWGAIADAEALVKAVGATEVLALLQRLGFWVGGGQNPATPQRRFNADIAGLTSNELGNETGYWQSELSRATAILGALRGQQRMSTHRIKRRKDIVMVELIREHQVNNKKLPTQAQLAATVAVRPEVLQLEEAAAVLDSVIIAFDAAREAVEGYCRVLSRELTRRGDMHRAGL